MATEDILINDGDSFISLSALAAEQVEAKLPIESDDGTVTLDSPSANTFTVSTGAFYLDVGNPAKNITIGDNTSGVAGGDGVYIMSRTNDIAFSSNEIRFNSNWSGGATSPTWVMTTDSGLVGNNNANYVKCGRVSGVNGNDASVELGANLTVSTGGEEQLVVSSTDISASSTYKPATENSLTTKRYVDQITGSNVEDIPFGGKNTDWKEKSITVEEYIDGNPVLYSSSFGDLVAANGIFSDGLHWSGDGITWYSSGRDKASGDLHVLPGTEYKVLDASDVPGVGLYVTGRSFSTDMKSWFRIMGKQATYPFMAGDTVYANQGNVKLASGGATGLQWVDAPPPVDMDGYLGSQPDDVATGTNGLAVAIGNGSAFWGTDLDGTFWQKIDGPTGCKACVWVERLQRFIFISGDKWWCSTTELPDQGMKSGSLPVSDQWSRMCDDGESVTAMCTTAGKNTVLTMVTHSEVDFNANGLTWKKTGDFPYNTPNPLNNRGYTGLAGTNGRTIASMASVSSGSQSSDYSVTYYYSVAGENRDLGVFTDDVKLVNAVGTRAVIDTSNLKTQEDANLYFDGRLDNAGNLPLGAEDAGGVWAAGTIGKALEDISKNGVVVGLSEGRLTAVSMNPAPQEDAENASIVYFTPYLGNKISIYEDSQWVEVIFDEVSLNTTGLAGEKIYDVFASLGGGQLILTTEAWATDQDRATELLFQSGVAVSGLDSSKRYVGTLRTNLDGTFNDTRTRRHLWNSRNPITKDVKRAGGNSLPVGDPDRTTHTYDGPIRPWLGKDDESMSFVSGLTGAFIAISMNSQSTTALAPDSSYAITYLGINSTTDADKPYAFANAGVRNGDGSHGPIVTLVVGASCTLQRSFERGFNTVYVLENTINSGIGVFASYNCRGSFPC